jgi:hypothetical protein
MLRRGVHAGTDEDSFPLEYPLIRKFSDPRMTGTPDRGGRRDVIHRGRPNASVDGVGHEDRVDVLAVAAAVVLFPVALALEADGLV